MICELLISIRCNLMYVGILEKNERIDKKHTSLNVIYFCRFMNFRFFKLFETIL